VLVKLKYLRRERDGRLYLRRHGRAIRLHAAPGSEAFLAEYEAALAASGEPARPKPGAAAAESFAWLCLRYFASAGFRRLAPSTQTMRRRILGGIAAVHGHKLYRDLAPRHVEDLLGEVAGGAEAKNSRLKALRALYAFALGEGLVAANPAKAVAKLKSRSDGFYTWSEEDIAAYRARHKSGSKARLALELLLFAGGPRRSDVVRLGRQMVQNGWLVYRTAKGGMPVTVPLAPELRAEIERAPRDQLTFLVTDYGRPYSAAGFGNRFRAWCDAAGLPGRSAHGLRKAGATMLAERGASEAQLRAIFGWDESSNEPRRYTRAARRKRLAAEGMKLWQKGREDGHEADATGTVQAPSDRARREGA
jgi:integrase